MRLGWDASIELFSAYGAILSLALIPIYIGAKRALSQATGHFHKDPSDPNRGRAPQQETMSSKDAWMFPLVGSTVLFGLYILFKFFSKEYINLLLTGYFLLFGLGALSTTLAPWLEDLGNLALGKRKRRPWQINFNLFKEKVSIEFTFIDIIAWGLGLALITWYAYEKHWIANNLIGLAFCIQAIAMISLGSYKIGCILLCGLFFYDIFWVFGTDVMVTVAKSFDAPVKLLFPRNLISSLQMDSKYEFSMLGLGDIVIPGIFLALLLRFDSHRQSHKKNFSPIYFWVSFASYFFGLATTIAVMHVFRAAQPALLYLVPACIGSSFLTAVIREELGLLLAYSEEEKEKEEKEKEKKKAKSSKSEGKRKQQQLNTGNDVEEQQQETTTNKGRKNNKGGKKKVGTTTQTPQETQEAPKKVATQQQAAKKASSKKATASASKKN